MSRKKRFITLAPVCLPSHWERDAAQPPHRHFHVRPFIQVRTRLSDSWGQSCKSFNGHFLTKFVRTKVVRTKVVRTKVVRTKVVRTKVVRTKVVGAKVVRIKVIRIKVVRTKVVRTKFVRTKFV